MPKRETRTLTIYRDDSTVQVVYNDVKTFFWTANNTVLVISKFTHENPLNTQQAKAHYYIHWPRERFCWFKDEPNGF